jgi:hypothetical protein
VMGRGGVGVRDEGGGWVSYGGGECGFWGTNVSVTYPHDLYSMACIYALVRHFHAIASSSLYIFAMPCN